jgi:asparagine synthase (glutamine-hydrolysing)
LCYGYPEWNQNSESLKLIHEHQALFPWNGIDKKIAFIKFILKNWRHVLYAGYPFNINDKTFVEWTYKDYIEFSSDAQLCLNGEQIEFKHINVQSKFRSSKHEVDQIYDLIFETFMSTQCLYLADRQGMGNAIEIRSPFLDYKLVEFVSSLPTEMKYKPNNSKYLLKETLKGIVPEEILTAQKKGFTPPIDFIQGLLHTYKYETINSEYVFFNSMLADKMLSQLLPLH